MLFLFSKSFRAREDWEQIPATPLTLEVICATIVEEYVEAKQKKEDHTDAATLISMSILTLFRQRV
jgi:hypothetical protein